MPRGRLNASRKAKQEAARAKHAAEEAAWAERDRKAQERDNAREESRHAAMDAAMAAAISIHRPELQIAHADNSGMRRREFMALLGGAAAVCLAARGAHADCDAGDWLSRQCLAHGVGGPLAGLSPGLERIRF